MKFFIDTADIEAIREAKALGMCDGVTTNPSLVSKTGKDFDTVIKEITSEVDGPISLEVISLDEDEMVKEAEVLSKKAPNVVVKIPMTANGLKAIKRLSAKGIKTNCTLVFSANQGLMAAKAGATYVSPFIGRLDDIGHRGMDLVEDLIKIFRNYDLKTQVLAASIRHPLHVIEAARLGAHVATIPPEVIKKLAKHPLTDIGIERFLADWEKVGKG